MHKRLYVPVVMMLVWVSGALAQATPPAGSGAPATPATNGGGGMSWLWIIIALLIVAAIVWYFMRGRSRITTANMTGTSASSSTTPDGRPRVYDDNTRK